MKWNIRINLTAIRDPEEIVSRHFGESLFAARNIVSDPTDRLHLIDVGSGAGFPGLAIKLWAQNIQVTLIEANHKKATFLREVIRALKLSDCDVYAGRAEEFSEAGDVVTLRAVERFEDILPTAFRLVKPTGRIAMLIADPQKEQAIALCPAIRWLDPVRLPQSDRRILLIGELTK